MASAGRILIMPKGDWAAETEYEMLDLVYHNGTSWLAKKTTKGIEPSEANKEYWHKVIDTNQSTFSKDITIQKADNGKAMISKNHSDTVDYGTEIFDFASDGKKAKLMVKAYEPEARMVGVSYDGGAFKNLFGEHNIPLLKQYVEQIIADYLAKNN